MRRRFFLWVLPLVLAAAAKEPSVSLRGTLVQQPGKPPAIETLDHKRVLLEGDKPTTGVLNDKRLAGSDMELIGRFKAASEFEVNPIYTRAIFVHKGGKRLMVTYYCKVCAIRTYTPGHCWCCQQETDLDLIESDQP